MKHSQSMTGAFVLVVLAAGCNWMDEKPRGMGASGRPLAVLEKAQIDMERFFKYSEEQEKVIQMMHQSFETAAKAGPSADDPKAKALTEVVKKSWDDLKYVQPKEGRKFRYRVVLSTNNGDLVLDFFEGFQPDVVRNFVTRAKSHAFDGQTISVDENALVFGPPLEKQAYTLPARPLKAPLPKGTLFSRLVGDRAAGEQFGVSLKRVPGGGENVSMFGRVANPALDSVLGQLAAEAAKKPGSVVIKSAKVETFDSPIFEGPEVRLPRLDKKGNLDTPDLAMFTGVANPDVDLKTSTRPSRLTAPSALVDPPLAPSTIPSKNPNVPPAKDDKQSPKSP